MARQATTKRNNTVKQAARMRACHAKGSSRKSAGTHPRAIAIAVATAFLPWYLPQAAYGQTPPASNTLPNLTVTSGQAVVNAPQGNYLQIDQQSHRAVYSGSMSIGSDAHMHAQMPGSSSAGLFKDVSGSLTQIYGRLSSNGQIFVSNQNGVLFGSSARVDVGALFATSLSIKDHDFMAGRYSFYREEGAAAGSVVNRGTIITANGYTALAGPQVRNDGLIIARAGSVALAAGDRVTLDLIGDGLISLSIDQAALNASAINAGTIQADGGTVLLAARSANALLDTVVNNSGVIRANSLVERNGEIVLDGGTTGAVENSGSLQAAAGSVMLIGNTVALTSTSVVGASGGTVNVNTGTAGHGSDSTIAGSFNASEMTVSGGSGDDTIRVDSVSDMTLDGGRGSDTYYVTLGSRPGQTIRIRDSGTDGGFDVGIFATNLGNGEKLEEVVYDVGGSDATGSAGVFTYRKGTATQQIDFTGLEPTTDLVPAALITVTGTTPGAITVDSSGAVNTAYLVDLAGADEDVTFLNKDALTLNAPDGANTISINLDADRGGAGPLTAVTVNTGNGSNTVNLTASFVPVTVNGGIGSDTLQGALVSNVTLTGSTANGFAGSTAAGGHTFTNVDVLNGSGTLTGRDVASTWSVNGGTYSDATATLSHTGFATLQGGTAVDTFTLTGAATFNLNGGDGVDVFALGGNTLTGSIDGEAAGGSITGITDATLTTQGGTTGFNGTSSNISTGTFSNITALTGSGTLTGRDVASTWALDGSPTYSDGSRTLDINGFGTLQGQTGIDTFDVTAASAFNLNGGAGVDVFNLNATLTGSINGNADGATLDGTSVVNATLSGPGASAGYNGSTDASALTGTFSNITTINANGGGTLTGTASASDWSLNGTGGSYTDNSGANSVAFTGFADLQGGAGIDTFTLAAASTFDLLGGGGIDVFALATNTLTGSIDGEVNGGSITGVSSPTLTGVGGTIGYNGAATNISTGTFSNITNLTGTGTLTGTGNTSAWSALTGTGGSYTDNAGTNNVTFSGFGTLQGGAAVDTFTLTGAATLSLNGGGGIDVFALATNTLTGSIDGEAAGGSITGITDATLTTQGGTTGFNGTSSNISTGTFSNITALTGSGTLTGRDVASTWAVNGNTYNDGSRTLTYSGFTTLQGGSAIDTFNVSAAVSRTLNGGDGVDLFNLDATLTGNIDGQAGGGTLDGANVVNATLTAAGGAAGFNGTTDAAALNGNFSNITTIAANGGGTLTGTNNASTWTLSGTGGTYSSANALSFSNFAVLQGGNQADTFTVAAASTFNLFGGAGADTFNINPSAILTGSINGEADSDTLAGSNSVNLNGLNSGTATGLTAGFTNVENLTGTAGNDTFTLANGSLSGGVNGLGGTDTLVGKSDAPSTWTITNSNTGTLTGLGTGWSNIENLSGSGVQSDTFIGSGGSVDGTISDGGGGTTTLSGTITSGGAQQYVDAVTLTAATTVNSTGSSVLFNSTIGGGQALTVGSSTTATFNGAVTTNSLSVTAGTITLANVTTAGAQSYTGNVTTTGTTYNAGGSFTVNGNTTLNNNTTVAAGGSVAFSGTVNADGVADGDETLTTTGGNTTFGSSIGGGSVLGGLNVTATGALNLPSVNTSGNLSIVTTGNITQSGIAMVTGTTNLQAGVGSIVMSLGNDFGGMVTAGGSGGITLNDINALTPGTINAGAGAVNLSAVSIAAGGTLTAGTGSTLSSNAIVSGLNVNMQNVALHLTGSATQWNLTGPVTAPNPITVTAANVGVTYNGATVVASVQQQQAAAASSTVSASVASVIVDEANKTFGTDSVAEAVEYGFAGEVGATPPMDHRIDNSGISLPRCVEESREGEPCK